MNRRRLGKTGFSITEVSLGTWQVGGKWGSAFDNANAEKIINSAIDGGVNFIDTADVYSDGESEKAVGRVVKSRSERIYVATKCGRQIRPHVADGYTPEALRSYVEGSLKRTGLDRLDLIQLHCPPGEVYYRPEIFGLFEDLKREGKIAHLGVSVEKIDEALKASEYDNVTTVQIIFNMFRQRPAEDFFPVARQREIGIIVRVPLASGLLSGKFTAETTFGARDHRSFNRDGSAFDKGETFSGVPFETGLQAVEELKELFSGDTAMASIALRWILMFPEVTTVIPGASRPEQVISNIGSADLPPLTQDQMDKVRKIYDTHIKPLVHTNW
ncbi:aldo/keto reductase [Marispirochaeta aestuarii]|uniref:aldo/keto reductase n=1 Tax=Marispirochaeta aestuarii TaxID=1963862 RepID=UPI0029C75585|nr:aldo/keto reductase [Marispirochaeta aestuarii]